MADATPLLNTRQMFVSGGNWRQDLRKNFRVSPDILLFVFLVICVNGANSYVLV